MQKLDAVDAPSLRDDIPPFRAGDTLKVHVKVIEGNRSRIQVFQGVVIARRGQRACRAHVPGRLPREPAPGRHRGTHRHAAERGRV